MPYVSEIKSRQCFFLTLRCVYNLIFTFVKRTIWWWLSCTAETRSYLRFAIIKSCVLCILTVTPLWQLSWYISEIIGTRVCSDFHLLSFPDEEEFKIYQFSNHFTLRIANCHNLAYSFRLSTESFDVCRPFLTWCPLTLAGYQWCPSGGGTEDFRPRFAN